MQELETVVGATGVKSCDPPKIMLYLLAIFRPTLSPYNLSYVAIPTNVMSLVMSKVLAKTKSMENYQKPSRGIFWKIFPSKSFLKR